MEDSSRSILALDKSTAPFPAQILEACAILGIELPEKPIDTDTVGNIQGEPHKGGPRIDWTLRWLLKNFHSANVEAGSPHVDPNAWLLFSELVLQTPLSTTSRLLKAFDFPRILHDTLQWLLDSASQAGHGSYKEDTGSAAAIPSSIAVEAPAEGQPRKPRKRKRNDNHDQPVALEQEGTRRLHVCICSSRGLLLELSDESQTDFHGYAVEHLRAALRTSIECAARILGLSLTLASIAESTSDQASGVDREYSQCILPAVKYWRLHMLSVQDSPDQEAHRAFSKHSLLPCLQMVKCCSISSGTLHRKQDIVGTLQHLVERHTILPARASQLSEAHGKDSQTSETSANLMDELLASVMADTSAERDYKDLAPSTQALFDIAIRIAPLGSPKERRFEISWLQKLFIHISKHFYFFNHQSVSIDLQNCSCRLVQAMLRAAVDQSICFDGPVLEQIIQRLFGGFELAHDSYWGVIGVCMEMNASIFASRQPSSDANDQSTEAGPQNISFSLFDSIRKYDQAHIRDPHIQDIAQSTISARHSTILKSVIFPLVHAFADARDFHSFLRFWQDQLTTVMQECDHWETTVWEETELLQLIDGLTESSLTTAQIEHQLLSTCNMLSSLLAQSVDEPAHTAPCMAMLIILESLVSGCRSDSNLQKLKRAAFTLQEACLGSDITKVTRSRAFRSRFWKLFATLNDRWPLSANHQEPILRTAEVAMETVVDSVQDSITDAETLTDHVTPSTREAYGEKVQALRFILSLASIEHRSGGQSAENSITASLSIWVGKILNRYTPFCDGELEPKRGDWGNRSWNIGTEPSTPVEFAIASLVLIVHHPSVLKLVTTTIQCQIYEEVYQHASNDTSEAFLQDYNNNESRQADHVQHVQTTSPCSKDEKTTSRWLWSELASAMLLQEENSLAAGFRDFQVSKYPEYSDSRVDIGTMIRLLPDFKAYSFIICRNDVALELLRATPAEVFTKTQRANLCNLILQQVVTKGFGRGMLVEALHQLTSFVRMPSATMGLLSDAIWTVGKLRPDQLNTGAVTLFIIAGWLDDFFCRGKLVLSAVTQFKQLAFLVMEYLTNTLKQSTSSQYIQTVYQRLNGKLERGIPLHCAATSALIADLLSYHGAKISMASGEQLRGFPSNSDHHKWRSLHLAILCKNVEEITSDNTNILAETGKRAQGLLLLQCMAPYMDLIVAQPESSKIHVRIAGLVQKLDFQGPAGDLDAEKPYDSNEIMLDLARVVQEPQPHAQDYHDVIDRESSRLVSGNSRWQRGQRTASLRKWFLKLDTTTVGRMLRQYVQLWSDENWEYSKFLMAECLLSSQIDTKAHNDNLLDPDMANVVGGLCDALPKISTSQARCVAMRCLVRLLKFKPKIIAQHHVDSLLSSITVVSHALKDQLSDKHAGAVYLGLCKLFSMSLLSHRKKLGGRYHLVVQALQGLLRCLFIPYTIPERTLADPSRLAAEFPLGQIHGAAYARLLSTICDPPLSSLSRSKENPDRHLNDEAKKARDIAGQHMQYVMEEWCACQLSGRLLPEIRAGLEPGLWTVFAAMPPDVMRKLNAAMDASGRSIFKALYDDFKRAGH